MQHQHKRMRLRNWGRQILRSRRQCPCQRGDCLPLADLTEGMQGIVFCNNDLRTIERGIYVGARISIFRNETEEPNLVVAVGDARYVLDRRIAREIRVRIE